MQKITVEELMTKMGDLSVDEADLAKYFTEDTDNADPFAPRFRLNPETVEIPEGPQADERTAAAMNGANWFAKMHRRNKFYRRLSKGYDGPIIVSEGDSWFQYPLLLKDTIDHLSEDYAVYSLGAAGDLLQRMADKQEYVGALQDTGAQLLLLSGGGNDLVANGALASHLEPFDPELEPEDYLLPSFQALLDNAIFHYGRMFAQVRNLFPHVSILCHGYDYPVPDDDRWLGKPMASRGITDLGLQKQIAASMMDQFNRRLRRLVRAHPHVRYIDCRGIVGDSRWYDGLHPTDAGYRDVADRFKDAIDAISGTRSGPPGAVPGPFGPSGNTALARPAIAGGAGRGISLHVGLNTVDPAHYAGWDGALKSCEADAIAMKALADAAGYEATKLLTKDATRAAVVEQIKQAAADLKAGDMFLFSVSAHGGRIPDFNQDEDHDGDEKMDETLCLYDFQLADDELYMLWTEFRAGVRVLMVPDTCHSGSMVRFGPAMPTMLFGQPIARMHDQNIRAMPMHVEDQVWRANEAAYRNAQRSYDALKESVMMAPLTSPIKASVLNLGACRDTQFARDGVDHGAFTGALLKVWNSGAFHGDYRSFRNEIDAEIDSVNQTPQLFEKLARDDFGATRPFTISPGIKARPRPTPVATSLEDEGDETDTLSDAEVQAILEAKTRGAGFRNADAALSWPDYADFDAFIRGLGLKNFSTDEFLILGGAHTAPGGACRGKNTYPPRALWPNIAKTAQVLDHFRHRIGKSIVITNAYRAPGYNVCIGGAEASQHKDFRALDFKVSGMAAPDVAVALRWLRDREGLFVGGIGQYNSFTHIDTRPTNGTWPKAFRDSDLAALSPLRTETDRVEA
ncbi:MAG: D-Ala-D-Ala carboxypeptidase family metallohydrolase [Paracoccaceae bacterium]